MLENNLQTILPPPLTFVCIILLAFLPLLEVRAAVPFGLSSLVGKSLSVWSVCLFSLVGACLASIASIFIFKFFIRLANKNKKINKYYAKFYKIINTRFFEYQKNIANKNAKKAKIKKWWAVALFTAVPLPMSGAWAAGVLSVFLQMSTLSCISAIFCGNVLSIIIMALFCTIFYDFVNLVLAVFVIISLLVAIYYLMAILFGIKKSCQKQQN